MKKNLSLIDTNETFIPEYSSIKEEEKTIYYPKNFEIINENIFDKITDKTKVKISKSFYLIFHGKIIIRSKNSKGSENYYYLLIGSFNNNSEDFIPEILVKCDSKEKSNLDRMGYNSVLKSRNVCRHIPFPFSQKARGEPFHTPAIILQRNFFSPSCTLKL